jgi:hypothetical protein
MLVLFGVVAKNAILQIDHTLNLRGKASSGGPRFSPRTAIGCAHPDDDAGAGRRHVPLALGDGPGAENGARSRWSSSRQSLSLFLTLVMIPVAYSLFDDLAVAVRTRRFARAEAAPAAGS